MLRKISLLVAVLLICTSSYAAPLYFTENAVLPDGLATLTTERSLFRNTSIINGVVFSTESFESFTPSNSINFGAFTVNLFSGIGFDKVSNINLITTEGSSVLKFETTGETSVEFVFNDPINAFGVDITSIDFKETQISFSDNLDNVLDNFAIEGVYAGATFFGVYNDQSFTTIKFSFANTEALAFDYLQFGAGTSVPEPSTALLLGMGLVGTALAGRRMRKASM